MCYLEPAGSMVVATDYSPLDKEPCRPIKIKENIKNLKLKYTDFTLLNNNSFNYGQQYHKIWMGNLIFDHHMQAPDVI